MTSPAGVDVESVAELLDGAHLRGVLLDSSDVRLDGVASAYAVQRALTARRVARGARRIGWKLGYTTAVMRAQMGIAEPNLGPLLDTMVVEGSLGERFVQPRVEPEVALLLGADLSGDVGVDEVLAACSGARAALEVVDSVWTGYRFDLEHNTADGSSAAGIVLGDDLPLDDLPAVRARLLVDGAEAGTGVGADASGHPAAGVAWLASRLAEAGESLRAGDVVLTGGLTAAAPMAPGSVVRGELEHAGGVAVVEVTW